MAVRIIRSDKASQMSTSPSLPHAAKKSSASCLGFLFFLGFFLGGGGESGEQMDEAPSHAALGPTDHHLRHTATRPTATGHQNVRAFVIFST